MFSAKRLKNSVFLGIITYPEYLFLLTLLTSKWMFCSFLVQKNDRVFLSKSCIAITILFSYSSVCTLESSRGLDVAFRMLDLDGNATLGKAEFQEVDT